MEEWVRHRGNDRSGSGDLQRFLGRCTRTACSPQCRNNQHRNAQTNYDRSGNGSGSRLHLFGHAEQKRNETDRDPVYLRRYSNGGVEAELFGVRHLTFCGRSKSDVSRKEYVRAPSRAESIYGLVQHISVAEHHWSLAERAQRTRRGSQAEGGKNRTVTLLTNFD